MKPTCPKCGGAVYDNRDDIASGKQENPFPKFKCKKQKDCGWKGQDAAGLDGPPPTNGNGNGASHAAPAPVYTFDEYLLTAAKCWRATVALTDKGIPDDQIGQTRSSVFGSLFIGATKLGLVAKSAPKATRPPLPPPAPPASRDPGTNVRPAPKGATAPSAPQRATEPPQFADDPGPDDDDLPF